MRKWPFGIFEVLREEAPSDDGEGSKGGGGGAPVKQTLTINGKEVTLANATAALNLYEALADKEAGPELIEQLARRSGILKDGEKPTSKTADKIEGRITKILKSKLGKDYEQFADTLGPIIDEGIQEYLNEHKTNTENASSSSNWDDAVDTFKEDYDMTPEIESKMESIIKRNGGVPKGLKGKAAQEYLSDMYELAVKKLGGKVVEKGKALRGSRPTDDDDSDDEPTPAPRRRQRRAIDEIPDFREEPRPKGALTIDQIVDAAARGIRFKN
jgi:hypothetical protein